MSEETQNTDNDALARNAVLERLNELGLSATKAAEMAGLTEIVVVRFLQGGEWPRSRSLGRLEAILGWPTGSIRGIANGDAVPSSLGKAEFAAALDSLELPVVVAGFLALPDRDVADAVRAAASVFVTRLAQARRS